MNRPVIARGFSKFVRAINRVDDPYAFGAQASTIVGGLFGQDHIIGARLREGIHDVAMSSNVTFIFEIPIVDSLNCQLIAQFDKHDSGLGGNARGELLIGFAHNPRPS